MQETVQLALSKQKTFIWIMTIVTLLIAAVGETFLFGLLTKLVG